MRRNIGVMLAALAIALAAASCSNGGPTQDPSVFGSRRPLTQEEKDLVKPPDPTQTVGTVTETATTYFVPFGSFSRYELQQLQAFAKTLGVTVEILPRTPLSDSLFSAYRVVGERMIDALVDRFPKQVSEPSSTVIGFTGAGMRLDSRPEWTWAFGLRDGNVGIISSDTMEIGTNVGASLYRARLRKMTGRYLGRLSLGLQFNADPMSMLYTDLLGVDDLDRMQERF